MRIVLTTPNRLTKIGLITTRAQLAALKPEVGWPRNTDLITQAMLDDAGVVGGLSIETEKPAVGDFQRAVADDEQQQDFTWLQTWTVVDDITLAQAKAKFAASVLEIYWHKVVRSDPTVAEVTADNADPAAIMLTRRNFWRPRLNTARTAVQDATTVADCIAAFVVFRDA